MGLQGVVHQKRCPLEAKLVQKSLNVRVVNPVNTYATNLQTQEQCTRVAYELQVACLSRCGRETGVDAHRLALAVNVVKLWSVAGNAAKHHEASQCAACDRWVGGTIACHSSVHVTAEYTGRSAILTIRL